MKNLMEFRKFFAWVLSLTMAMSMFPIGFLSASAVEPKNKNNDSMISFTIRAYIDGISDLVFQNGEVYWQHYNFAAPGRHNRLDEPTIINDYKWMPWEGMPGELTGPCTSSRLFLSEIGLNLDETWQIVDMNIIQARESVSVSQFPSYENDYAGIISFNDRINGGAAWYEIELFVSTENSRQISVELQNEFGKSLLDGYSVRWYEKGGSSYIATGDSLAVNQDADEEYEFEVLLEETLGTVYADVPRQIFNYASGQDTTTVTLQKIPNITVTGCVVDETGSPVVNASVLFTQYPNGRFTVTKTAQTNHMGIYTATVLKSNADVSVNGPGYVGAKMTNAVGADSPDNVNLKDITLYPSGRKCLTLTLAGHTAAEKTADAEIYSLNSFSNLSFSVKNISQGSDVTSFTADYPFISLYGQTVRPGDILEITAKDELGLKTAVPVRVELNSDLNASVDIAFIDNGLISAVVSRPARAMIFDSEGNFVASHAFSAVFTSKPLLAGNYTVVFIENVPTLTKTTNLNALAELGLVRGTDYTAANILIQNGVITVLENIDIPRLDKSKFSYTSGYSFTVNKSTLSVGAGIATYRLEYTLDEKYTASNETVEIEFPKGLDFAPNSITVDGKSAVYIESGNRISVVTNKSSCVIRFCAYPTLVGDRFVAASLTFDHSGGYAVQPLGEAQITATALNFSVPRRTGQKGVPVTGYASPHSQITVYDNGIEVANTVANANGAWRVLVSLHRPLSYSTHTIYVTAKSTYGVTVQSEKKELEYNPNFVDVSKVTMINVAHPPGGGDRECTTVIDFSDPDYKAPFYYYYPVYTTFTFTVEFTKPAEVSGDVTVVTQGANGESTYIPAVYDSSKKVWVGTARLDSYHAPVNVDVRFEQKEDATSYQFDDAAADFLVEDMISLCESLVELDDHGDAILDIFDQTLDKIARDNGITVSYTVDQIVGEVEYGTETVTNKNGSKSITKTSPLTPDITPEALLLQGYTKIPGTYLKGECYFGLSESGTSIVDFASGIKTDSTYVEAAVSTFAGRSHWDVIADMNKQIIEMQNNRRDIDAAIDALKKTIPDLYLSGPRETIKVHLNEKEEMMQRAKLRYERYGHMYDLMSNCENRNSPTCRDTRYMLEQQMDIEWLLFDVGNYQWIKTMFSTIWHIYSAIEDGITEFLEEKITESAIRITLDRFLEANAIIRFGDATEKYNACREVCMVKCNCGCEKLGCVCTGDKRCVCSCGGPQCPGIGCSCSSPCGDDGDGGRDTNIIMDPSGYVYEAVPSNRLEGVETTAFKKDADGSAAAWNASDYDQKNPMFTDQDGLYYWDVPVGQWQVKYEKAGYETVYSDWLPVPPPQVDVNIGMVSYAPPSVIRAAAYENAIEIEFSKYMKPETVYSSVTVLVKGVTVKGQIVPSNLENGLASIFRFVPDESFAFGGAAQVSVSKSAMSYAAVPMTADYESVLTVQIEPKSIHADSLTLVHGESGYLTVKVEPASASAGRRILVTSDTPSLATAPDAVTVGADGTAMIYVTSFLPGVAYFTLTLEGTGLQQQVSVNIGTENGAEPGLSMDDVIKMINALPETIRIKEDADKVAAASKAYDALSDEHKGHISQEVMDKLAKAQKEAGLVNHLDGNVSATEDLPWYVRISAMPISSSDAGSIAFAEMLTGKNLIALYTIKLIDTLTGNEYTIPSGKSVKLAAEKLSLAKWKDIDVVYLQPDGKLKSVSTAISDGTVGFSFSAAGLYGITAVKEDISDPDPDPSEGNDGSASNSTDNTNPDNNGGKIPDTGENMNLMLWFWSGTVSLLGMLVLSIRRRKRR